MKKIAYSLLVLSLAVSAGCGYSTAALLPPELDSIYVENFVNDIDPAQETSDRRASYSYRPGLEVDITRAVIDGFIFDRHLDIKTESQATMTLKGELKDFRLFPLSYDGSDNVTEYRAELIVNIELINNLTGEVMWEEDSFMGRANYYISGPNAKTEEEALNMTVKDLSERIVERTVEAW